MQLDDKPIPIPTLEQIFFTFDSIHARQTDRPMTRKFSPNQKSSSLSNDKTTARSRNFRISQQANKATIATQRRKEGQKSKTYKFCVYCYKKGHDHFTCPDKTDGKPPSKSEWGYTLSHVIDVVN